MIRILIADDHEMVREGLKRILGGETDFQIVGEAADGIEALALVRDKAIDVLLLDMSMPGRSGIELIKQIKEAKPKLPILIVSMHREEQYAVRSIRAGASGYVCKDGPSATLIGAIRKLASGGRFVSPQVMEGLAFSHGEENATLPHTLLSDREFEVFLLLAAGHGVTDIAERLGISVKTISTHKTHLLEKMHLTSTTELVRYVIKHDLLPDQTAD